MKNWFPLALILYLCASCSGTKKAYNPARKFAPETLKADYRIFREILEKKHPSLYWYNSKDSIDFYFDRYESVITDSMTELSFAWQVLAPMTRQIRCGHTTVGMSKPYRKWSDGKLLPSFPLYMKVWNDSMVVTGNLHRKDSLFKRGRVITSISGVKSSEIIRRMFGYLPADGHAENINQVRLSANFPYYHRNIFGLKKQYRVGYIDNNGMEKEAMVDLFDPKPDSSRKKEKPPKQKKLTRAEKLLAIRDLKPDSTGYFAVMTINGFSGGQLRSFMRRSFRKLRKDEMPALVIDLRSNGGGHISLSTLLTKYIRNSRFRVADSVHGQARSLAPYSRYMKGRLVNNTAMLFVSRKKKDGRFHIPYMEKKWFRPKRNRYNGEVYVLTSGSTFSASSLFCHAVKGQANVTILGEETGGGWHGNNGVLIPEIVLPNTKLRVRLPLYRLVQFNHPPKNGTGVMPDILVGPDYRALVERRDRKMEVVREILREKRNRQTIQAGNESTGQ